MPFNLARVDFDTIMKEDSGITDWKEDALHLQNQLQREQAGSCDSFDFKQKQRENRKVLEKMRAEAKKVTGAGMDDIEDVDDDNDDGREVSGESDSDFVIKKKRRKKRESRKKIDVMGPVSLTADRLGL